MAEGTYVGISGVQPWYCGHCGALVYRVVYDSTGGYPAKRDFPAELDAPPHQGFYGEYGPVCRTCKELVSVIEDGVEVNGKKIPDAAVRDVFKTAHREWLAEREKEKKLAKKLGSGEDYLAQ